MATKSSKIKSKIRKSSKDLSIQSPGGKVAGRGMIIQHDRNRKQIGSGKKVLPQIKKMTDRFDDMIAGCLDNLPPKPPSEVRIFLSSTFSDMRAERNALAKISYPEIKEYCSNKLDLDFQVVDLRWGINTEATNNHVTGKICLREIENCQKVSLGANFMAVLSHRYGHRSIRPEIDSDEFDIILNEVKTMGIDEYHKLTTWYLKDENNIPPLYILQPIDSIITGFCSDDPDEAKQSQQIWNIECSQLQNILRQGVISAYKKGLITEETKHKYFKSVTEEEVEKGILEAVNPGSHAACFIRRIDGINQDKLSQRNATRYFDTVQHDGEVTLDEEVTNLIADLHNEKIPNKLTKNNIHIYKVPWEDGGISPDKHEAHQLYIDDLCKQFTHQVISMIEAEKHLRQSEIPISEYYTYFDELLHHLYFCKTKCENFRGRKDILKNVEKYLREMKNHKPLVIHAESGVGKTSVMAMIMKHLPKWFGSNCIRIIRFLGTSPQSTDIFDVLFAVMGQLADEFDMILEPVGYKNMRNLIKYLPRFLRNVSRSSKEHVFILLDSVDQLSRTDNAHDMQWLPKELPTNIHIILSMLPHTHGCLHNTLSILNNDKKCFLELKSLPMETSIEIIDQYLTKHKRTIKDKELILDDLKKDPKPLFLKLLLDRALEWRSYETGHKHLDNIRHAIESLFISIENACGQCATRAVIGYLTFGLNGLTELELEDVLSLDDEVLDSVYVYHDPPVDGIIHMPSIVLKRILYMLREYIVERRSENKKTLYWYHRQFTEYAHVYVNNDRVKLHKTLAELYLGEEGIKRTIVLTSRKKTLKDVDRQITGQPLTSQNKRKLQSLPYHLKNTGNLDHLKRHCLCNLKFMMCKLKAFSLSALLKDYSSDERGLSADDVEISLVMRCLKDMKDTTSASSLPLELLARLGEDNGKMSHINKLLATCRQELKTGHVVSLMPVYPCLGDLSQQKLAVDNVEEILSGSSDLNVLLLECKDPDIAERTIWQSVICSCATIKTVPQTESRLAPIISEDGKFLLTFQWNTDKTGIQVDVLSTHILENVASYNILPGVMPSAVTYMDMSDGHLTVALDNLEVRTFALMAEKSDGKKSVSNVTEVCKFSLNVDRNQDLKISCVFRIQLDRSSVHFVSIVTSKKDCISCIENSIVISNVMKDEQKQLSVIPLLGKVLSKKLITLEREGVKKVLLVSTHNSESNVYMILCCDIVTGQVLQQMEFPGFAPNAEGLPDIILGSSVAVPVFESSRWNLKVVSLSDGRRSENIVLECIDCPFCTFVTEDGDIGYCERKGGIYLSKSVENNDQRVMFLLSSVTTDVIMRKVYINIKSDVLTALRDDNKLVIWSWNDIKENLVGESVTLMRTEEHACKDHVNGITSVVADEERHYSKHLGNHDQVLSVLLSRDELQILTLDGDGCIRVWHLPSCRLSDVLTKVNSDALLECGELYGSIHSQNSEPSCFVVYLAKFKELTIFYRGLSTKMELLRQTYKEAVAYFLDISDDDIEMSKLYILKEISTNKYMLDIYTWPFSYQDKMIRIKDSITGRNIRIKPTVTHKYLVIAVDCTEKELEIIVQSVTKNHLKHHDGNTKFYSVDLEKCSPELAICKRQLTNIPCLANSWEPYTDNLVALGFGRIVVLWDLDKGSCDQGMIKGTKIPMLYRPGWIEHDEDYGKICSGRTTCITLAGNGKVLGIGSEDGYLLAYDTQTGKSIVENVGKKPNHGNKIEHVAVSADGKWMASYCCKKVLKLWDVVNKMKECSCIGLGVDVNGLSFSRKASYLVICTRKPNGERKAFIFELFCP